MLCSIRVLVTGLLVAVGVAPLAAQTQFVGRVVGVTSGDTIQVLRDGAAVTVRLEGIEAPADGKPFSAAAKKALSGFLFGQDVIVTVRAESDDGAVGRVYKLGDASLHMVREGLATSSLGIASIDAAEVDARERSVGLWNDPTAVPTPAPEAAQRPATLLSVPSSRATASTPSRAQPAAPQRRCGSKRFCKEMSSCSEAYFYLRQCGLTRLDGDGDGVPCESIC